MKLLAIDSCSMVATGAVIFDNKLVSEFVINDKKTHSVKLLPQIENMLYSIDMEYSDMDYIACTIGPGSFTGERIGVATAKALAHAFNIKTVGVSALEALAYNIYKTEKLICPIMDARREQVYTATYKFENGKLVTVKEIRAMALKELLEEFDTDVIFVGDGVDVFEEKIKETLGDIAHFAPFNLRHLNGGSVGMCAVQHISQGDIKTYKDLLPIYLRLSQAERELKEKQS